MKFDGLRLKLKLIFADMLHWLRLMYYMNSGIAILQGSLNLNQRAGY